MQLGMFPFDNTQYTDSSSTEAHQELWAQQMERTWSDLPRISEIASLVRLRAWDSQGFRVHVSGGPRRADLQARTRVPRASATARLADLEAAGFWGSRARAVGGGGLEPRAKLERQRGPGALSLLWGMARD